MDKDEDKVEKTPKPKKKSKKDDVLVKNTIEINPTLKESQDKTIVLGWGRMNPVTVGHEKLANKIKSVAKQKKAKAAIYLTHSQDAKKNPLSYDDKVTLAKMAFGNDFVVKSKSKTIFDAMKELQGKYNNVVLVVGQDRVREFDSLLKKYNGKDYNFDEIEVVSAGDRDPDAEGVEGMSASKMRAAAKSGDFKSFKSGLPRKLQSRAKSVYDMVRGGMKLAEMTEEESLQEILTIQQRRKKALTMRRYKTKIAMARKRMRRRFADAAKLKQRSRKKAIQIIRKKVAGSQGANYKDLSPAQKMIIDKKVAKRGAVIDRIAKKLLPQVRKADRQKLMKREDANPFITHEVEVPKKKRFHQMFNKEGNVKLDKRFNVFKPKKTQFEEIDSDKDLLNLIEQINNEVYLDENNDAWGTKKLASITFKKGKYKKAIEILKDIIARKKKETGGNIRHGKEYYAAKVARQISGVDARTLANMIIDEEGGAGDESTAKVTKRYKKDTPGESIKEQKVAQDPDVKDQPGTQPKKYYKGLSDKEKEARAKQFRKGVKADDDSESSYKSAPGDEDAKTKESQHTKKYKRMFGEDEVSVVRTQIDREIRSDKVKHDQMIDRARIRRALRKNRETRIEEYELSEDSKATLMKKADKTGIPYSILKKVYDRGMAAWKTGHRPGASQQQWAYARVNSFATKSKGTWGGADKDLAAKVRSEAVSPAQQAAIAIAKKKKDVKEEDPCWDGYKQVGMKNKNGKQVPNCVKENIDSKFEELFYDAQTESGRD